MFIINIMSMATVAMYMKSVCNGFDCPEKQNTCKDGNNNVAFCIRRKEHNSDFCDKDLLSQIYEYPLNCVPSNCPARIKDYCAENPCKNEGKCSNFPGSYSCKCQPGYHGRDCSLQGGHGYSSNVFFIYDPIVGWKQNQAGEQKQVVRSKAMIFINDGGVNTSIVFTTSCSAKVKMEKGKKDLRIEKTAREKCEIEFEDDTVRKYCQYIPPEKMLYLKLYYDIPWDNTNEPPGSVVLSYNRDAQTNIAAYKVTKLSMSIYNDGDEEFRQSFTQISVLQRETGSECLTPVNLLISGMRCVTPLKRKRNEKISIKNVFDTQVKFESGLVCSYSYPVYNWQTYRFDEIVRKPNLPKVENLPSKNCSQFGSDNYNCHESFEIKPFELDFGIYEVKLTVNAVVRRTFGGTTLEAFPFETFGLYFVEIEVSPLIAVIEGGDSRTVSESNLRISIDGSRSYDPNRPSDQQDDLQWSWGCRGTASDKCCKDVSEKLCEVVEKLKKGTEYEFILTLTSKSGLSSQAIQKVTVSNKPQLQLEIRCLKNCGFDGYKTNPRETVYMEVVDDSKFTGKTKKPSDMSFLWQYSCESKTTLKSVDAIKQDDVNSHVLIVKEDKLTPGSECKFTVQVDSNVEGVEGQSSIVIQVNKPPDLGVCNITSDCQPNKCFKARAKFTISCSDFDSGTSQLIYSFYQTSGQVSPGTLLGFSMCGELNNAILTEALVIVRVSDQFGMYTDFNTNVPVDLQDWTPTEKEMEEMLRSLETYVLSRDSSGSAMLAGAILDAMANTPEKHEILENILVSLIKDFVNDLSDVRLYASTLKKIVTKGIKELKLQLDCMTVELLGALMERLSRQLLLEVNFDNKKFPTIFNSDIQHIVLTLVESADVITGSENEMALDVKTGTLAVLARTNQYKAGTASMVRSLVLSGMAILDSLLPHQQEVVIKSGNTTMWTKDYRCFGNSVDIRYKLQVLLAFDIFASNRTFVCNNVWKNVVSNGRPQVESPIILAINYSGIPPNSSTRIKMSKEFGERLQMVSENVALQVITFANNPYWWDVEDRDVASEVISLVTYGHPESGLRISNNQLVTDISVDLDVYLKFKTTRSETIKGTATMPNDSVSEDEKDVAVAVHTLAGPPENSNGKLFVEFQNLQNNEFQVLLTENVRPDYQMMDDSERVNAQSPLVSFPYNNVTADTLHFIGILPGKEVSPGHAMNYTITIYSIQCKMRQQTVWTSPACRVGEETTKEVVHCKCSHMSFFGSSIFVAPNTVHPIKDIKLLLTVKDNPLVFTVILIILMAYVILLLWALLKDKRNKAKRQVIVLEDNFPGESYSYLVVVYTSFNVGSGTDSNVGIMMIGSNGSSRKHILRSQQRRVFRRNSDDWFLILTQTSLENLIAIHLWHDNSGSHPDWFCQKVVVYDIPKGKDYTFIVEQWLSVWPGEFTETVIFLAGPQDVRQWKRVVMHNILYNLREKHLWLSIYMSHPRATVTKSQRVTIAFCVILITLLTGVMYYGVARGGVQIDDPRYKLKLREFIIVVQSVVFSTLATAPVVICFRRSQIIVPQQNNEQGNNSLSDIESLTDLTKITTGTGGWLKDFMGKIVRGKPLIPVVVGKESAESVIIRRRWAICGWVISQGVIWGSGYFIILHGLKLGKVISELWLTSAGLSISYGALFNSPVKIIFFSIVLSMFGEMYNVTTYEYSADRPLQQELVGDLNHMESLIKLRSSNMYKTLQREQITEYRKAALRHLKLVESAEFLLSIILLLIILYMSSSHGKSKSFYITSHLKLSLAASHGPLAVPLDDVVSVKSLTNYLVSKLFRVLYKGRWYNKRVKLTSPAESLPKMGWFSDAVHRMVGIPRMRQLRVKFENCSWIGVFNVSNAVCAFHLSPSTEDTGDYGLHWGKVSQDINKPLQAPWTYQYMKTQVTNIYGVSGAAYHTGGYIVDLYDTQDKCNTEISDLIDLEWWDVRMRAFIVELTLYNPNTDTYSLITLVTEHLPSGAVTNRIHVICIHLGTNLIWILLYLSVLLFFNVNLFLSINRDGVASTLSNIWGYYELLFVGLSDIAILFNILKAIKMSTAVHVFQKTGSGRFFFFPELVWFEKTAAVGWIAVLCLTPVRLFKFKPFVSTCRAICNTFYNTRKLVSAVSIIILSSFLLQAFVINFKICPENLPFQVLSRFYTTSRKEVGFSGYQLVTSLLPSIVPGMGIVLFKVILINAYKLVNF